ncbi:MAG: Asp-tRNA(Asn)/Glu-tRNA(Gln) amidotransferase subunit GatB [Actinobacteria bacterium]|nr:Asp-tRNA(Asn)/Glu-tRNA(Gln) amidotransferase subunit GatB [Actinomycetota bacterium]MCL6104988.1 Asp-tRNA(Asn)/Glu-tRNA(Gln) amidotransferase subunit GatB [Actinomycetota bacterium]
MTAAASKSRPILPSGWEMVVGLEVHCELRTQTKLFCSCKNIFGDEPNTNICPVCLGLPGSLPVLNSHAVELAMLVGFALHCEIRPSIFHRKNYFYPDMPKDYQITQYDEPINVNGYLELSDGTRVRIERAHLEEDTGKTIHVGELGASGRIHQAQWSCVDYNRAGVPLLEIVSMPDIRSALQARAYVSELRGILLATNSSDAKMEEGSLRVDANVSVRRVRDQDESSADGELGTRCEIKNLNSLRSLVRAIDYEATRQVALLESAQEVVSQTRHWIEDEGKTLSLRSKEEAFDYRYFPEPDLLPLAPGLDWQKEVVSDLPPMPQERRDALANLVKEALGDDASLKDQVALLVELGLDTLATEAISSGADPRIVINRLSNEAPADHQAACRLDPKNFTALVVMEKNEQLTPTQAKAVLVEMLKSEDEPLKIAQRLGFETLGDQDLSAVVLQVVAEHQVEWSRYVQGEQQIAQFLVGQVMKLTKGRADGAKVVRELNKLGASENIEK